MATSNFYSANCSRYFVIGTAKYYTQDDIDDNELDQSLLGEYDPDGTEVVYEYERESILEGLEAIGWQAGDDDTLAEYTATFRYAGCEFSLELQTKINPGYYEGACMDFDGALFVYDNNGYEVGEYDVFGRYAANEDDVRADNWTGNQGLSNMQARNIVQYIRSFVSRQRKQAEEVFSRFAEYELTLAGRFNDGSSLYNKVEKRLCES